MKKQRLFQSTLPSAGSDAVRLILDFCLFRFQSTLPSAGSDLKRIKSVMRVSYFNPRSPVRGATYVVKAVYYKSFISIHAPQCGERPSGALPPFFAMLFQSTLPSAGSDYGCALLLCRLVYFNPRSPVRGATASNVSWSSIFVTLLAF